MQTFVIAANFLISWWRRHPAHTVKSRDQHACAVPVAVVAPVIRLVAPDVLSVPPGPVRLVACGTPTEDARADALLAAVAEAVEGGQAVAREARLAGARVVVAHVPHARTGRVRGRGDLLFWVDGREDDQGLGPVPGAGRAVR